MNICYHMVLVTVTGHRYHSYYINGRGQALSVCVSTPGTVVDIDHHKARRLEPCARCFPDSARRHP